MTVIRAILDQCYKTNFTVMQLPLNYSKILMPYFWHKMSLHLQICTVKMKITEFLETGANMSTLKHSKYL